MLEKRPASYRSPAIISVAILLGILVGHRVVVQLSHVTVFVRERVPIPQSYSNFIVGSSLSGLTNSALSFFTREAAYDIARDKKVSRSDIRDVRRKLTWSF